MQDQHLRRKVVRRSLGVAAAVTGLLLTTTGLTASADGTETLGTASIDIASGTDIDVGGTGLVAGPGTIDVDVPAGNSISQVIVYWEGQHRAENSGADDTIVLDGNTVTGTLIGGPTLFFGNTKDPHWSSTYRADVTSLGLVSDGSNSVAVSGLSFDQVSNGAGLLVISDSGETAAEIAVRDGNDLAYSGFAPPLDTTVPQVFNFAAAPVDRTIELVMFASSVEGTDLPGERPNVVEVVVGDTATRYQHLFGSYDGDEWDTVELLIDVPAGVGSVTVQALSVNDDPDSSNRPASFAWLASVSAVPPYVPPTTTTTTTTVPESTTTEPTTTTTEPATTTTVADSTTTTTEVGQAGPTSTTTLPITTTTVVGSSGPTPTTIVFELPATGVDSTQTMVLLGMGLMALGLTLLVGSRRPQNI